MLSTELQQHCDCELLSQPLLQARLITPYYLLIQFVVVSLERSVQIVPAVVLRCGYFSLVTPKVVLYSLLFLASTLAGEVPILLF